jgi:hypothetical protein
VTALPPRPWVWRADAHRTGGRPRTLAIRRLADTLRDRPTTARTHPTDASAVDDAHGSCSCPGRLSQFQRRQYGGRRQRRAGQKSDQIVPFIHRILVSELDEFAGKGRLEHQVAGKLRAGRAARAHHPQQHAQTTRQSAHVACGDHPHVYARRDHQCRDLMHPGHCVGCDFDHTVEALHMLDVGVDLIHEQGVEHVAEQLPWRRWPDDAAWTGVDAGAVLGTHANYQQPIRSQMNRGAERPQLPLRAVTEIFIAQLYRWKQKWHPQAGHHMIEPQAGASADALLAHPLGNGIRALEEGHRGGGSVTGRAQRERFQIAAIDTALQLGPLDVLRQQRA